MKILADLAELVDMCPTMPISTKNDRGQNTFLIYFLKGAVWTENQFLYCKFGFITKYFHPKSFN